MQARCYLSPQEEVNQSIVAANRQVDNFQRFKYYSEVVNETVIDHRHGLMWAASARGGPLSMQAAKEYCEGYRIGGFSDWRLPTLSELKALYQGNLFVLDNDIVNGKVILAADVVRAADDIPGRNGFFDFDYGIVNRISRQPGPESKDNDSEVASVLPVRSLTRTT